MAPSQPVNWKLILPLSMFGLAMGLATTFLVASSVEPYCWLVIFIVCAYLIVKRTSRQRFLHGVFLGLANSVWITAVHIVFMNRYLAAHLSEARMMNTLAISPRLMMATLGVLAGLVSGVVIGVFVLVMSKLLPPSESPVRL